MKEFMKFRTREEIANSITHFVGLCLSVVGLFFLIFSATSSKNNWRISSFYVYGISLIILYGASFLYHSVRSTRKKYIAKMFDHFAIYLLIAGTYTPFTLISLRAVGGKNLFIYIWCIAAAGIILKIFFINTSKVLSTIIYLIMSWLIIIFINPLIKSVPANGILLLIVGGVFYSLGTIFYLGKKIPFHHAIWHLFVLGGSIAHYFAILLYV
ncbi:MAG: hemolysin III family protein [Caldisericota bacterium]|nr:hemolysin III family protein [Caldisericota bacterium]